VEAYLEKQKLESSLRLAHDIQMSMLPKDLPEDPRFQLFATLRPAREVGGDLYDFLCTGPYLWFLIGDVSGKGVPAALFMAMTKVLFDAGIASGAAPAEVVSRVNHELCRNNDQGLYVTAFLGRLDLGAGELLYTNAGHNPTYHLQAEGAVSAIPGDPDLVLGVMDPFEYRSQRLSLAAGDALFLYTDGVTEAQNPAGEEFSPPRLEGYLRDSSRASAHELGTGALRALEPFVGTAPQFDDTTILCLRYLGGR
jgi:sigma-B regulation protein RsbU (phosphoserine phosphatase)